MVLQTIPEDIETPNKKSWRSVIKKHCEKCSNGSSNTMYSFNFMGMDTILWANCDGVYFVYDLYGFFVEPYKKKVNTPEDLDNLLINLKNEIKSSPENTQIWNKKVHVIHDYEKNYNEIIRGHKSKPLFD